MIVNLQYPNTLTEALKIGDFKTIVDNWSTNTTTHVDIKNERFVLMPDIDFELS